VQSGRHWPIVICHPAATRLDGSRTCIVPGSSWQAVAPGDSKATLVPTLSTICERHNRRRQHPAAHQLHSDQHVNRKKRQLSTLTLTCKAVSKSLESHSHSRLRTDTGNIVPACYAPAHDLCERLVCPALASPPPAQTLCLAQCALAVCHASPAVFSGTGLHWSVGRETDDCHARRHARRRKRYPVPRLSRTRADVETTARGLANLRRCLRAHSDAGARSRVRGRPVAGCRLGVALV
jgi:hypothetical protein